MIDRERTVERTCRWCRRKFRVQPDYPKRQGCPECAPRLELELARPQAEDLTPAPEKG